MARVKAHPDYDLQGQSYVLKRQNLKDAGWRTEIGDSTSNKFEPKIRIHKWDEVFFGIKLPAPLLGGGDSHDHDGSILWWRRQDVEVRFYDIPDDESEFGGYEYEVTLHSAPPTNQWTLEVETSNVEWVYQPLDINEYGPPGTVIVPDRVLGSYAIYATGNRRNNKYKAGKVAHLYRPFAQDAIGQTTWCAYNADVQTAGQLTISIPQAFLDIAVYPIVIDPTVGHTSIGGSAYTPTSTSSSDYDHTTLRSDQVTTGAASIVSAQAALYTISGSFQTKVTVYDKGPNVASDDLVATSNARTNTETGTSEWRTHTITGSLSAATDYQAGIIRTTDSNATWYRIYGDYNNNAQAGLTEASFTPPSTLSGYSTTATLADRRMSVYFTYATTNTLTFTADAYLESGATTQTVTFTADAYLYSTTELDFTGDAYLYQTTELTFTADAYLVTVTELTFAADAYLYATLTVTLDADAYLYSTTELTFTADAYLVGVTELTFTADSYLYATPTATFDADAYLYATTELTFAGDAYLFATTELTFTADGYLYATIEITFSADAYLQSVGTITLDFTADAYLYQTTALTFDSDAYLYQTTLLTFTGDGYLYATVEATFTADAYLESVGTTELTFTGDAYLYATRAVTFTGDAYLKALVEVTFAADAYLVTVTTVTFSTDAYLYGTTLVTFDADAYLYQTAQVAFTADAYLSTLNLLTFTADSYLYGTLTATFTADAYLYSTVVVVEGGQELILAVSRVGTVQALVRYQNELLANVTHETAITKEVRR